MIRRILVPLDPSPYTAAATAYAGSIAKALDAEVTGLAVLDLPALEEPVAPVPLTTPYAPGEFYYLGGIYYAEQLEEGKLEGARERVDALLDRFREHCEANGLACRLAEEQGTPSERIIQSAMYYDLVVMGLRTYYHFETSDKPGDSLDKVLGHSITPVIAVTASFVPKDRLSAVIAYDGSLPAARAMQHFAQLARTCDFDLTVLMAYDDEEVAAYHLDRAVEYLEAHGFRDVKKAWTGHPITRAIDEEYLGRVDVVIVGPHSKRGLFHFRVGSLTKHLIEAERAVVFIGP